MKSMTAFTHGTMEIKGLEVHLSISSFNSRFFDLQMNIPSSLHSLQMFIYDILRDRINRGRLEVNIKIDEYRSKMIPERIEEIKKYIDKIRDLKDKFNIKEDIGISIIKELQESLIKNESYGLTRKDVKPLIEKQIDNLIKIKKKEGDYIKEDLIKKIKIFKDNLKFITDKTIESSEEHKDRIMNELRRLNELDIKISKDDINMFAFKGDVDEEIVRLNSHVKYFHELLMDGNTVGRRLRFLLQEMFREVNTIGSKAYSAEIVHRVIDLKELLDEMKEQVENIE